MYYAHSLYSKDCNGQPSAPNEAGIYYTRYAFHSIIADSLGRQVPTGYSGRVSVVKGHFLYKKSWMLAVEKDLTLGTEDDNEQE